MGKYIYEDRPVRPVRRYWHCGADCEGVMEDTGKGFSDSFGKKWMHRCSECGREEDTHGRYPRIVFEE